MAPHERCGILVTERRTTLLGAILLICIFSCSIVIATSLNLVEVSAQRTLQNDRAKVTDVVDRWVRHCQDALNEAVSLTMTLEGLVLGSVEHLPSLNDPPEQRIQGQDFRHFNRIAGSQFTINSSLLLAVNAPGGVPAQVFPPDAQSLLSVDLFNESGYPNSMLPTAMQTVMSGRASIIGPIPAPSFLNFSTYYIEVRHPVYNITNIAQHDVSNFWGFTIALVGLSSLAEDNTFTDYFHAHRYHYVMYTRAPPSSSSSASSSASDDDCITVLYSSFSVPPTNVVLSTWEKNGMSMQILTSSAGQTWYVAVPMPSHIKHTSLNALIIICVIFALHMLMLVVLSVIVIRCTTKYRGLRHAMVKAPFALLTVGPSQADELWAMASDQMIMCVERLNATLADKMQEHQTYLIPTQLIPDSSTYVFPSVESAVRMAFDVIEELQQNPPDERLRELLGEDEQLLMTYAVHWCTDATVTEDKVEDALLYAGPDVAYAGRMWVFSSPNTVTLSEAAKAQLANHEAWQTVPLRNVYLHGVDQLQALFCITDPHSAALRDAAATATRQLRRLRRRPVTDHILSLRPPSTMSSEGPSLAASLVIGTDRLQLWRCSVDDCSVLMAGAESVDGVALFPALHTSASAVNVSYANSGAATSALVPRAMSLGDLSAGGNPLGGDAVFAPPPSTTSSTSSTADGRVTEATSSGAWSPPTLRGSMHLPPSPKFVAPPISVPTLGMVGARIRTLAATRERWDLDGWEPGIDASPPLQYPVLSRRANAALRRAFSQQAMALPTSYGSAWVLVAYINIFVEFMFSSFTAQESRNLQLRLSSAFGIPQRDVLVHVSACCAVRYLKQHPELIPTLWKVTAPS